MNKPKITVITVCYNAEKCIEKTIKSVLEQDYNNIEYIIVDGKSSDSTMSIINRYKEQISHVISEKDKGIYDAMNKGIDLASGEWVNFMNAGDTFANNKVLSAFCKMLDTSSCVVFGDEVMVEDNHQYLRKGVLYKNKFPDLGHQSTLIKADLMKKYHYDTSYKISADFDFLYKLYKQGLSFQYINLPISCYDISGLSSCNKYRLYKEHCMIKGITPNIMHLLKYKIEDFMPIRMFHILHRTKMFIKSNLKSKS